MKPLQVLLDADTLLFRAALGGARDEVKLPADGELAEWTLPKEINIGMADQLYHDMVDSIIEDATAAGAIQAGRAFEVQHFFTDSGLYRRKLYPDYKANRKGTKPELFDVLRLKVMEELGDRAYVHQEFEADDAISLTAWAYLNTAISWGDYLIVGLDKDLLQIPGNHYRLRLKQPAELCCVDYQLAAHNLAAQALTGDSTDNIPGVPGLGPKGVEKIMSRWPGDTSIRLDRWYDRVEATYLSWGLSRQEALLNYRLVRLLTPDQIQPDGTITPWKPTPTTSPCPAPPPPPAPEPKLASTEKSSSKPKPASEPPRPASRRLRLSY